MLVFEGVKFPYWNRFLRTRRGKRREVTGFGGNSRALREKNSGDVRFAVVFVPRHGHVHIPAFQGFEQYRPLCPDAKTRVSGHAPNPVGHRRDLGAIARFQPAARPVGPGGTADHSRDLADRRQMARDLRRRVSGGHIGSRNQPIKPGQARNLRRARPGILRRFRFR